MRRLTIPSVGILLWVLHVAPFVHVHGGDFAISNEPVVVHSHLPASEDPTTDGPAIDDDHSGQAIDLFASVTTKPFPDAVPIGVRSEPAIVTSDREWIRPVHAWKERGPPLAGPPLRAPPA